jgi:hypothetical protein
MHNRKPFVPAGFDVPERLETQHFTLRMLTIHDLVKDYDAVMSSIDHLQSTYSAIHGGTWPVGLTLEDDLIDLGWHQREFTIRSSFAYTVMAPDETRCLGCIYINPTVKRGYDAMVMLWVRASELASGLDWLLYETVKAWIDDTWPFENVAYPGREIDAAIWRALPEKA